LTILCFPCASTTSFLVVNSPLSLFFVFISHHILSHPSQCLARLKLLLRPSRPTLPRRLPVSLSTPDSPLPVPSAAPSPTVVSLPSMCTCYLLDLIGVRDKSVSSNSFDAVARRKSRLVAWVFIIQVNAVIHHEQIATLLHICSMERATKRSSHKLQFHHSLEEYIANVNLFTASRQESSSTPRPTTGV
jgi:hypothetical protein